MAGITTLRIGRWTDRVKKMRLIIVAGYTLIGIAFSFPNRRNGSDTCQLVPNTSESWRAIYAPAFDAVYTRHLTDGKTSSGWGALGKLRTNLHDLPLGATVGELLRRRDGFDRSFYHMPWVPSQLVLRTYIYFWPRRRARGTLKPRASATSALDDLLPGPETEPGSGVASLPRYLSSPAM